MSTLITCQNFIYAFSKENEPSKRVAPGSTLEIETFDCFQNQITTDGAAFNSVDWDRINPATGPIYVENANVGDILAVKIEKIELADEGVMAVGPNLGVLGERISQFETKIMPIEDGQVIFNDQIKIPLNPMIGVIGVAPAGEAISCGTPGAHGGNMDTKLVTTGATLYFPVFVEGALFALGDLHAAMGDGEIGVTGVEIPGKVTVTLDVIKGQSIKHPFLVNEEGLAILASAKTLDEAVKISVEEMTDLLLPLTNLSLNHFTMLMSAVGETQISQVVDPLLTARFFVPKWLLKTLNIQVFK